MPVRDAPTREQGTALGGSLANILAPLTGRAGYVAESYEDVPELRFPISAAIYDRVRKDAQVEAILSAIGLPILRAGRHRLDNDGVRPEVTRMVEANLGLGDAARLKPRGTGVDVVDVKRDALLMLPFGFMALEQSYAVQRPPEGLDVGMDGPAAFLRLSPRMPRSITEVRVDREGRLLGLVQLDPGNPGDAGRAVLPGHAWLDVSQLVMFVRNREGADWTGNSILRSAYKHWLIKDALLRVGPMVVERNGMGLPVVTYPENGDRQKALDLAKAARMGAEAGVAVEEGYTLSLQGVQGNTRDELPLIKFHDESIGRSSLAMFLNLGHDNGARSLGDTFVDYFVLADGATDDYLNTIITEHIIRDLVEVNYGEAEPYPRLTADPIDAESTPTAEALVALEGAGLLGAIDPDIVAEVRRRYGMPAVPPPATGAADVDEVPANLVQAVGLPALVGGERPIMAVDEARKLLKLTGPAPQVAEPIPVYQPAGEDPTEGPPVGLPIDDGTGDEPVEDPAIAAAAVEIELAGRLETVAAKVAAIRAGRATTPP